MSNCESFPANYSLIYTTKFSTSNDLQYTIQTDVHTYHFTAGVPYEVPEVQRTGLIPDDQRSLIGMEAHTVDGGTGLEQLLTLHIAGPTGTHTTQHLFYFVPLYILIQEQGFFLQFGHKGNIRYTN